MEQLMELAKGNLLPWIAVVLLILSWVFEVSKIKISPWSWLFGQIAQLITKDVKKEITDVNKRLDDIVYIKSTHYQEIIEGLGKTASIMEEIWQAIDENEMNRLRWEILSFADSLRSGNIHSIDAFRHIIEVNDKYHRIIDKRGFVNGVIDAEMAYITEEYKRHLKENDF